jgi:hypothetical protein
MPGPLVSQVAQSIPFDNTGQSFNVSNVQDALVQTRAQRIWDSETNATTLNGTLTLSAINKSLQFITGTQTGYSVVLPSALTLFNGWKFEISNTSSQSITIKNGAGVSLGVMAQTSIGYLTLQDSASTGGTWVFYQAFIGSATGILNYNVVSTTPFVTTSLTDVLIAGFTITPTAGTYAVWYNASVIFNTTPKTHWWNIYKAGVKVADSERSQDTAHATQTMIDSTMSVINVNGLETVEVKVRCQTSSPTASQLTVNARTLLLIRLGV